MKNNILPVGTYTVKINNVLSAITSTGLGVQIIMTELESNKEIKIIHPLLKKTKK